jgi:hypothetical protein
MNAMTIAEARGALALALVRMQAASDALSAKLTEETLRRYIDANSEAQAAHHALLLAAMERARQARE